MSIAALVQDFDIALFITQDVGQDLVFPSITNIDIQLATAFTGYLWKRIYLNFKGGTLSRSNNNHIRSVYRIDEGSCKDVRKAVFLSVESLVVQDNIDCVCLCFHKCY